MYLMFCQTVGGCTSMYSLNRLKNLMYCSVSISPFLMPDFTCITALRSSSLDLIILKSNGPK